MSSGATPEEIVRLVLEAMADRDGDRLRALLAEGVTIRTQRGLREGPDEVLAWARKGYDHLDKRIVLERLEPEAPASEPGAGGEAWFLGIARVEYVWRETGEVGDASPVFLVVGLRDGLLARFELHEAVEDARAALDG